VPLYLLIIFSGCQQGIITQSLPVISLSGLDIGVTDVVLEIAVANANHNQQVSLERDGQVIRQFICSSDSLIYDENLLPDQFYTYQAFLLGKGEKAYGTAEVKVTTMDTTTHEFEWETFNFGGQVGSSTFYDVAIINENDIWAVGELFADTLNPIDIYNAVHWNGMNWELKRIYVDYNGEPTLAYLEGIFELSEQEIIFTSGLPYLPENSHWKLYHLWDMGVLDQSDGGVNNIWGTKLSNVYFAGRNGTIVYYNDLNWQKIESGISENIQDIWGVVNNETNQPFILCPASQKLFPSEKIILNIQCDGTVIKDNWSFNDRKPYSVWFKNRYKAFACGDGVFIRDFYGNWKIFYDNIPYFLNHLRGTDVNNIFAVDDFGYINHFNGSTWQALPANTDGRYLAVAAKGDIAVAVGDGLGGRPAVVTILKRKN
jgi:hypothetical protein